MRYRHGSGHSTVRIDEDRFLVQRARVALDCRNMERDMFNCCVFPTFFVRMKFIGITLYFVIFIEPARA